jgi:hypothetical protein
MRRSRFRQTTARCQAPGPPRSAPGCDATSLQLPAHLHAPARPRAPAWPCSLALASPLPTALHQRRSSSSRSTLPNTSASVPCAPVHLQTHANNHRHRLVFPLARQAASSTRQLLTLPQAPLHPTRNATSSHTPGSPFRPLALVTDSTRKRANSSPACFCRPKIAGRDTG